LQILFRSPLAQYCLMDLQIERKVAFLVGGCGTLGQACAQVLSDEGATVVVGDRPASMLPTSAAPTVEIDVTNQSSVREAVARVVREHGRIDVLVMLAGIYQGGPLTAISHEDFNRVLAVNLTGTFLVCREVLPIMQQQDYGRIICIASLAGQVGGVVAGANYAASKAGVLSLVKSLVKQSAHPALTVNAVNPGPIEGTMTGAWTAAEREQVRRKIPLQRFATPEEVASIVAFLASPRAAFIHGAHIDVNGGIYMD
jgi:3-oxoacyl-[acyl-carrier protein] reductase